MYIDIGGNRRYSTTMIGTITFQRESDSPLRLKDVMFFPGLNKYLISIVVVEYCRYDVIFKKGKEFPRHISMGQVKHIGVHVKNFYNIDVEDCATLSTKVEKVQIHDVGELWHKILGHLQHSDLKIMQ